MKIEIRNLSKTFKNYTVIKNVNIIFESGNIYGLIGRNGSGKSVFQKLICGLYLPTSGKIFYNNIDINEENNYPQNVGALIEHPSFFPDLTGYQNLKMLSDIQHKIGNSEIENILKIVNLYDEKDKKVSKYSLGMKQKLGIDQAIMENPDVIILDEPFNGIDRESVKKISKYLVNKKKEGKLIIISTHIIEDIKEISDYIIKINEGTVCEEKKELN